MDKQTLRKKAAAHRADIARTVPDFANRIASFANELNITPHAIVAGTCPMGDEADPRALMATLAARGHALALPRVEAKHAPLVFHRWREGEALITHKFGMSEPHVDREIVIPDIVLVPLLAFDAEGYRLGYGGGFYDRTLDRLRAKHKVRAIGVAYAGQEVDRLPRDAHDHALDAVLTETGLRAFTTRPGQAGSGHAACNPHSREAPAPACVPRRWRAATWRR
jgi:5-formyltetrahydrofolate cyclo-ligase